MTSPFEIDPNLPLMEVGVTLVNVFIRKVTRYKECSVLIGKANKLVSVFNSMYISSFPANSNIN